MGKTPRSGRSQFCKRRDLSWFNTPAGSYGQKQLGLPYGFIRKLMGLPYRACEAGFGFTPPCEILSLSFASRVAFSWLLPQVFFLWVQPLPPMATPV
jgi:hypothetical protein